MKGTLCVPERIWGCGVSTGTHETCWGSVCLVLEEPMGRECRVRGKMVEGEFRQLSKQGLEGH